MKKIKNEIHLKIQKAIRLLFTILNNLRHLSEQRSQPCIYYYTHSLKTVRYTFNAHKSLGHSDTYKQFYKSTINMASIFHPKITHALNILFTILSDLRCFSKQRSQSHLYYYIPSVKTVRYSLGAHHFLAHSKQDNSISEAIK